MKKYMIFTALSLSLAATACSQNNNGYGQNQQDWQHKRQEWAQKERMVDEAMFNMIDVNGDGVISKREYMDYTRNWFKEADEEHNSKLTFDEFMAQVQRNKEKIKEHMHNPDNGNQSRNEDQQQYEEGQERGESQGQEQGEHQDRGEYRHGESSMNNQNDNNYNN